MKYVISFKGDFKNFIVQFLKAKVLKSVFLKSPVDQLFFWIT